ncbi:MAG: hypothetical protein II852_12280 [Bacteroidales bacterium]|nr:hypothetical protein [Bacteroidales bacterium]
MDFLTFRKRMYHLGCFNVHQIAIWEHAFDRNNLTRWCAKGLLVKLKNEFYAFPEYKQVNDFARYIANKMYRPSYISLHSALSFYGIIPEEVVSITSVTTMKTNQFVNDFGTYTYQKVKRNLFFGYEPKLLQDGRAMLFATPEKAILDLLYLYPFYRTEQDMIELRFDDYFMQEDLAKDRLQNFLDRIKCKALDDRVKTMLKAYGI